MQKKAWTNPFTIFKIWAKNLNKHGLIQKKHGLFILQFSKFWPKIQKKHGLFILQFSKFCPKIYNFPSFGPKFKKDMDYSFYNFQKIKKSMD